MLASEQATWGGEKNQKAPQIEKWGKNTQVCAKMVWRKLITVRIGINKTLHDPFCQWGISGGDRQVRVLMNSLFLNSLLWAQHKPLHKSGSLWTVGIIYIKCASQQNVAKFLFPTGRKSYFMAVIPLSRIQRLAVGNRGGREAHQQEEGVFCLLVDGVLLNASSSWESCWLSWGRQQWGGEAKGKSLHLRPEIGFAQWKKTSNFVGVNPALQRL